MTFRKSAQRAKARWTTLSVIVAMATVVLSGAASATLAGTVFEGNDGNLIHAGSNTDWDNVAGLNKGIDLASGSSDNSFGQGTKEDSAAVTTVTGSIPPNKNDLTRFYEASEHLGTSDYLYLAWERAVNIGNANLDFEINQARTANLGVKDSHTINRTAGDLLVTYDFPGSGTPTIGILRWLTSASTPEISGFATNSCFAANSFPCWGDRKQLNSEAEGAVNTGGVSDPIAPNAPRTLGTGLFGEAAINLTAAGVFPAGQCEHFGSAFLKSRSSSSFPAELKDFIAPIDVDISNCGTVVINKTTVPAGSATSFGYTTTNNLAAAFNLTGEAANRTNTITDVQAGSYAVTEGTTTGWTLSGISCSATGTGTSIGTTTNPTANFTVAAGGVVNCTFTNTLDKASPGGTSAPRLIPQDRVTVSNLDTTGSVDGAADKVMTVSLYGAGDALCANAPVYSQTFTLTANQNYVTTNGGTGAAATADKTAGYTITADGIYNWKVHYNGDSRNNTFDIACGDENVDVDLTP